MRFGYKLQSSAEAELYNLRHDPAESQTVWSKHPGVVKRLEQQITDIVVRGRLTAGPTQPNDTDWWDDLAWMSAEDYRQLQGN